jgi:hypothetical protein
MGLRACLAGTVSEEEQRLFPQLGAANLDADPSVKLSFLLTLEVSGMAPWSILCTTTAARVSLLSP